MVIAAIVILVIAFVVGVAWARDRGQQQPAASPPPVTREALPARTETTVKPKPEATAPKQAPSKPKRAGTVQHKAPAARRPTAFVPTRVWSWAPTPHSDRYLVRFFRGGRVVLTVRTTRPRLVVSKRFSFRPGRYRWTVVSIAAKARTKIVDSRFIVSATR
jgi:hypothetical protein